jgi:hypothetical protein
MATDEIRHCQKKWYKGHFWGDQSVVNYYGDIHITYKFTKAHWAGQLMGEFYDL